MKREVVVLGAGLAGLYAAQAAALHGAEVTLVEKSEIGTRSNCGELFTEIYTPAPESCKKHYIDQFIIEISNKQYYIEFDEDKVNPFVMTDKKEHELFMKKECEKLGVSIFEKTEYGVKQIGDRAVIDATGCSKYGGQMGKAATWSIEDNVSDEPNLLENKSAYFRIRDDMMGYYWTFPKGKGIYNVGEGVYDYKSKATFTKPKSVPLSSGGGLLPMPDMFEFINNMQTLRSICNGTNLKVGNAAGLVNSCLGGGEHLAVVSGMLAGELVATGRENKYARALYEIIGDEMKFGISFYEFIRNQDLESARKIIEKFSQYSVDFEILNTKVRKAMKNWITVPEVNNDELSDFIKE